MKSSVLLLLSIAIAPLTLAQAQTSPPDLWALAQSQKDVHRYSTLFTAQDVRTYLSSREGLADAVKFCKETGITKVYLETFRGNYQAERDTLQTAKERFLKEGFVVSGCITTTRVGKASTGWKEHISCYTDLPTQENLQAIFEYTASLFDEIMIDDFWFTDCACPQCDAARKEEKVTIGGQNFPVQGDTWEDYRCELMVRMSQLRVLKASKAVNPKARLIIKYPQWYDQFHERGYEVVRQTADFDWIWVGTETRNYEDKRWGGTPQYEAYFIMRWLGGIGGPKSGGGWFDTLGTTEATYIEQARQTILGGARESMLFCYGGLHRETGPQDVKALRGQLPELFAVAREVRNRQPFGLAAYKPPNSHPEKEKRVFDFVGMLGFPLVPCHEFPANAPAAFFSIHAIKDRAFAEKLAVYIKSGKPVLLTDGLAQHLGDKLNRAAANVHVLKVGGDPKSLLEMSSKDLIPLRNAMLVPLQTSFAAPNRVSLYLFQDGSWVIENFNDQPVVADFNGTSKPIPARGWIYHWK